MSVVRQACPRDAEAIARIEIETWRSSYAGMLPDRLLLDLSLARNTRSWTRCLRAVPEDVFVAEEAGTLIGFGNCGRRRSGDGEFSGEIYTLYVAPEFQGQGAGRALMRALFTRLARCGHRGALLWVIRANPSRFFYERLGAKLLMHRLIPIGGTEVEALAYGWPDLEAVLARLQ